MHHSTNITVISEYQAIKSRSLKCRISTFRNESPAWQERFAFYFLYILFLSINLKFLNVSRLV